MSFNQEVEIDYTNYRDERSMHRIRPVEIYWGKTKWHKEPQWLLRAFNVWKEAYRTYAMKDIHSWRTASTGA